MPDDIRTHYCTFCWDDNQEGWVYHLPQGARLTLTQQGVPGRPPWLLELWGEPTCVRTAMRHNNTMGAQWAQWGDTPEEVVVAFGRWMLSWIETAEWVLSSDIPKAQVPTREGLPWHERLGTV